MKFRDRYAEVPSGSFPPKAASLGYRANPSSVPPTASTSAPNVAAALCQTRRHLGSPQATSEAIGDHESLRVFMSKSLNQTTRERIFVNLLAFDLKIAEVHCQDEADAKVRRPNFWSIIDYIVNRSLACGSRNEKLGCSGPPPCYRLPTGDRRWMRC